MKREGKIIKIISNLYSVECSGLVYECRARGKFRKDDITPLVGDFVVVDTDENYILDILPRKNFLSRPMIANVDVGLIITSVKDPDLSLNLLDKQILCVRQAGIEPIVCLTKIDLLNGKEKKELKSIIRYYHSIGYTVLTNRNLFKLKRILKGKTVVLTGQTGAGKSSLLNRLDKKLDLKTSPISKALGRGVHTTRHVELFDIKNIFIADTPGFSSLDLNFPKSELKTLYPEFVTKTCKFDDCEHVKERDCGVKEALEAGKILQSRYENYLKFRGEME